MAFGVEKENGLYPFAVSIDILHALGQLAKEYFKGPTSDRRECSTRTVDEDDKEVEEVDDDGPIVGNGAYNTSSVVKNCFHNIKKYEAETDFNATENNAIGQDTVKDKTQESSKGVNFDTSIDNGVYGSVIYNQFKELLICNSLDEVNVCVLKLM